ncbi:RraA family protein [Lactobacillus sp. ESL0701]|uniref:RraA family protein n=1 Tax=Lactobacillus sp. ESL0701 TaxID=2983217 RepID=UPI0023FA1B48|nr:RraA family protein [Lactobacillus sp. ESL0701]MDF7672953.1 RraA family protein [Lactobacillus sp. ESL0701]
MQVGKRIFLKRKLPDEKIVKGFSTIPTTNVADCMARTQSMHQRIKLMSNPKKELCGPAFTVSSRSGDNLASYAALKYCHEGDVIVISCESDDSRAMIGEVMMTWLRDQRHVAGVVIDGPIRDIDALADWDLPIYATGTTPAGPYTEGPGEVNVPVACGNVTVNPGDIILGDKDGVISIPCSEAADLLPQAQKYNIEDDAKAAAFRDGTKDIAWVDKALEDRGFTVIDDVYRS